MMFSCLYEHDAYDLASVRLPHYHNIPPHPHTYLVLSDASECCRAPDYYSVLKKKLVAYIIILGTKAP